MNLYAPLVTAFVFTFLSTPLIIIFAKKMGLVDDPLQRFHPAHTHTGTIPRAGGLAIYIGLLFSILLFVPPTIHTVGIILGATILTTIGLVDDKNDVNPYARLVANFIAAGCAVFAGNTIPFVTNPFTDGVISFTPLVIQFSIFSQPVTFGLAHFIALIWIVWTTNIIGWSAGVDGQMPGYVAISAFILGLLSLRYSVNDPSQMWVTILAFIVVGAFVGFLPWNYYPQKIMPGYGGKALAGFMLALLGILSFAKLGTAILVLGVPMLDALATLIRRVSRKKSPVWADRGHLHHRLMDLGWGKRRIALFYWGVSAILGVVSLTVTSTGKIFAFIMVGVILTMFFVWVGYFTQFSKQQDPDSG